MSHSDKKINESIGELVTMFVDLIKHPMLSVFSSVVVFKYWVWFVIPVFPAAPHPTILQCLGLLMVVNLFKAKLPGRDKTDQEKALEWGTWRLLITSIFFLCLLLLFGWVGHLVISYDPAWVNTFLGM